MVKHVAIFPASHYIVSADKKAAAIEKIRAECDAQVKQFTAEGKLIEAQRIAQRTNYDLSLIHISNFQCINGLLQVLVKLPQMPAVHKTVVRCV